MATTLVNYEINTISEKLLIYNREFFSKISSAGGQNGLLSETTALKDVVKLNIPATTTETKYSTDQFGKFIKKIINFNIKNFTNLAETESELCFVNRTAEGVLGSQNNIRDTLINTLKVVNVFVDILEAYKHCIDNEDKATFDTGYAVDTKIERIELVSDKSRFWHSSAFVPGSDIRNVGFIRPVTLSGETSKKVLFLSIQSFNTEMGADDYNYKDFFTKGGSADVDAATKFLKIEARSTPATDTTDIGDYKHQRYSELTDVTKITELSLIDRDKTLIVLLLKTLFELDTTFRKQSVYALYYYYKFVQLYFTLIIHVSNVMFHDVKLSGTSAFRIATFNTTTNKKTHGVSAIEFYNTGSATAVKTASGVTVAGEFLKVVGSQGPSTPANLSSDGSVITRGKGYLQSPTLALTPATKTLKATIVPMVYAEATLSNDENIERLDTVIKEINETITVLLDDLSSTYSLLDNRLVITTNSSVIDTAQQTSVYPATDNKVTIRVSKPSIISALYSLKDKYEIVRDCIIYDRINKYSYEIKSIKDDIQSMFEITINAVFVDADIPLIDRSVQVYRSDDGNVLTKPADLAAAKKYSTATDFLEIKMKDTSSYKTKYISTRNDIYDLEKDIAFMTSKVERQNTIYETQNSKKIFLERQILAYNIILAIILLILVAINVVKVDKEIVKTVSLSCLGVIILLFVIYFISNMTYVETFAVASANPLYALGNAGYIAATGSNSVVATYMPKKIATLNSEINKLNIRFISYFEKLIITLPASDNFDFYKEITEVVTNDKENKSFTNKTLGYSKNQNVNNINSIKYELENNKLYLNTILISAIIFVGLYNMYINYLTDDKYLSLMIFIFMIIFIIILSYYYITANRRVKTVFKNIYWGPEFSKSF
jgi:uncharacterized integral membrane protein